MPGGGGGSAFIEDPRTGGGGWSRKGRGRGGNLLRIGECFLGGG